MVIAMNQRNTANVTAGVADGITRGVSIEEEFLGLVYADEDWLRAEFDAIIAAQWPPPRERRTGRAGEPGSPQWPAAPMSRGDAHQAWAEVVSRQWRRERSPPCAEI